MYQLTPQQITAWVMKHFPDCKQRKQGAELVINNPFDDDSGFHLNISVLKGVCHDWRGDAAWSGPINPRTGKHSCSFLNFVRLFLNCTFHQAAKAVSLASGTTVMSLKATGRQGASTGVSEPTEKPLVAIPPGAEPLHQSTQTIMAGLVSRWLQSRGVSPTMATFHNIHHLATDVIFPYYEYGQLVYWQQRSAINKVFRFPSEEQFGVSKGQFLYNFDGIEPASYLIVTESIFGCYTIGAQCGATGGADMTELQARKIKLLGPRDGVILSPDNDGAAFKSILHNGKHLVRYDLPVFFSIPPALPYTDEDGRERTTKDWNELYTKLKMPVAEIRAVFDRNITPLNESTRFKIAALVGSSKKPTLARSHLRN